MIKLSFAPLGIQLFLKYDRAWWDEWERSALHLPTKKYHVEKFLTLRVVSSDLNNKWGLILQSPLSSSSKKKDSRCFHLDSSACWISINKLAIWGCRDNIYNGKDKQINWKDPWLSAIPLYPCFPHISQARHWNPALLSNSIMPEAMKSQRQLLSLSLLLQKQICPSS